MNSPGHGMYLTYLRMCHDVVTGIHLPVLIKFFHFASDCNFSSKTVKCFCCTLYLCNISCNLHKDIGVFNSIRLWFCRSWEDQGIYRCLPVWLSSSCRWWYWPGKSCHVVSRSRQHSEDINVSTWSQENNSIEMHESISSHQSSESWKRNTDETSVDALPRKCIIHLMDRISVISYINPLAYYIL